jgi:hypothetical protein
MIWNTYLPFLLIVRDLDGEIIKLCKWWTQHCLRRGRAQQDSKHQQLEQLIESVRWGRNPNIIRITRCLKW